jgi:hypothetical protein
MMDNRYIVVVDEQSQKDRLERITANLKKEGVVLQFREINPTHYVKRLDNGNIEFDEEQFIRALKKMTIINQVDVFATDYNLIADTLKGINVIKLFLKVRPNYRRKIVIYSAQIESVLTDILKNAGNSIEDQVSLIKQIVGKNKYFFKSDGEFENKFKQLILSSPDISIDKRLIDELHSLDCNKVTCNLPPFEALSTHELANAIESETSVSQAIKKELVDHIIALLFDIDEYV